MLTISKTTWVPFVRKLARTVVGPSVVTYKENSKDVKTMN